MKNLIYYLPICLISISNVMQAQVPVIKKNLTELFWGVAPNPSKFDIRTKFHSSENFIMMDGFNFDGTDYKSFYVISAGFKSNYKTSYLGKSDNSIYFWFKPGMEFSYSRKISSEYFPTEIELCLKEFEELKSIFSKFTYKVNEGVLINDAGDNNGKTLLFYSSKKSLADGKYFLTISYSYFQRDFGTLETKSKKEGYTLEIILMDDNLY